ncbi:MAG: DUF5689 domain-containing protein, partial [Bacteroidota bacterium]
MKKVLLSLVMFAAFLAAHAEGILIISEVADPLDNANARFVELYNIGDAAVDFSTATFYIARQANGSTWASAQLTGVVNPGEAYVIATSQSNFNAAYGFDPNFVFSSLTGNGDDGYFIYKDGDNTTGTLYDAYGVLNQDGTGFAWEYLDGRAERVGGMTGPNATWTASEWNITITANVADFTPGVHSNEIVADVTPPVFSDGYPKIKNILDTSIDLLVKLDETSKVFYVVLESGATAPTVAEVLAGTGSAGATAVVASSFDAGTAEVTETISGLTVDITYDVYVVAQDDEATPNVQAALTTLSATTFTPKDVLMTVDFATDLSPFTAVDTLGAQAWAVSSGAARINGYSGGAQDNGDLLISPVINLDGSSNNEFSFLSYKNYTGPDMIVQISTDFTGVYDKAGVLAATWTPLNVTISAGAAAWTESGSIDLSAYSGDVYIAFSYVSSAADGAAEWRVDNFKVSGYLIPGSDATLSDLTLDGTTITGFDAGKLAYTVELPMGTTVVPTIDAVTSDVNATYVVTPASDLAGDAAARTTTVVVTAQDQTTEQTYSILFNPILEAKTVAELRAGDQTRTYQFTGKVLMTYKNSSYNQKYIQDATGGITIHDPNAAITTVYEIGDSLTNIKGTIMTYGGLYEFVPLADPGAPVNSGNPVVAEEVTLATLNGSLGTYESKFVKVLGVSFTATGDFASKTNYDISDASGSAKLRTNYTNLDYIGTAIPTVKADIQGVVISYNGAVQLVPRSLADFRLYGTDATLSDLTVNGTTVEGFAAATLSYDVLLDPGTSQVPTVEAVTTDASATYSVADATDLHGDAAARTTVVTVTAEDGVSTTDYSITFEVSTEGVPGFDISGISIYPVPANNELNLSGTSDVSSVRVIDIRGAVIRQIENNGSDHLVIDLSEVAS